MLICLHQQYYLISDICFHALCFKSCFFHIITLSQILAKLFPKYLASGTIKLPQQRAGCHLVSIKQVSAWCSPTYTRSPAIQGPCASARLHVFIVAPRNEKKAKIYAPGTSMVACIITEPVYHDCAGSTDPRPGPPRHGHRRDSLRGHPNTSSAR
jgi:hypothetical protein